MIRVGLPASDPHFSMKLRMLGGREHSTRREFQIPGAFSPVSVDFCAASLPSVLPCTACLPACCLRVACCCSWWLHHLASCSELVCLLGRPSLPELPSLHGVLTFCFAAAYGHKKVKELFTFMRFINAQGNETMLLGQGQNFKVRASFFLVPASEPCFAPSLFEPSFAADADVQPAFSIQSLVSSSICMCSPFDSVYTA